MGRTWKGNHPFGLLGFESSQHTLARVPASVLTTRAYRDISLAPQDRAPHRYGMNGVCELCSRHVYNVEAEPCTFWNDTPDEPEMCSDTEQELDDEGTTWEPGRNSEGTPNEKGTPYPPPKGGGVYTEKNERTRKERTQPGGKPL